MGFIQPSVIHSLAESLAIPKVSEDAAKALAPHIDVRLREIIQEACKFARHSKRRMLSTDDINNALALKGCEPLYGFGSKDPARFVRAAGHSDLYYTEDLEIPIRQVIEAKLPEVPIEVAVIPHWLAIDGVQPAIPENAVLDRPKRKRPAPSPAEHKPSKKRPDIGSGKSITKAEKEDASVPVIPPVRQIVSAELQVYLKRVKAVIDNAKAASEEEQTGPFSGWPSVGSNKPKNVSKSTAEERAILASLATDPGLHPLTVALVDLISEQVKVSIKHLPCINLLIQVARSLLQNEHIHLELYLHKLMSALMTCLVTKRLGSSPNEDHWIVRRTAAVVIVEICNHFEERYPDLRQRISSQLAKALADLSKPLTTHFGAVVGLRMLGPRAVKLLILPTLGSYHKLLETSLSEENQNAIQKAEACQVLGALLEACALCLRASLSDSGFPSAQPSNLPAQAVRLDFRSSGRPAGGSRPATQAAAICRQTGQESSVLHGVNTLDKGLNLLLELYGDQMLPYVPGLLVSQVWL